MDRIVTIRDQVYNIIKLRIANGAYHHGMHLQELQLAEDLQVSRSPVREALKQLVAEELLVSTANKGVYVREFTEKELHDVFDFRIIIEGAAVAYLRDNPQQVPRQQLLEIKENVRRLKPGDIDYAMSDGTNPHYAIVNAMGNEYLSRRHRQASYCTMSFHSILFSDGYEENIKAHNDIIDSVLAQDFDRAAATLHAHLISSREHICQAIQAK